jgi:nicotinamide riboside kinase
MQIALLGAPCTGKTQLAQALIRHLQTPLAEVLDAPNIAQHDPAHALDIILLCGLDVPATVSTGHDCTLSEREAIDQRIRQQLDSAGLAYQVVYGLGEERLENALFCIARQAPQLTAPALRPQAPHRWSGPCERCADGDCEHRLFLDLLKSTSR